MTTSPSPESLFPGGRARRRAGCVTALLVFLLALGVCALAYVLFPPAPLTILVLGLDARPGETAAESRADSLMLVGIHPAALQVSLLSIPRDLRLQAPGVGAQPVNTLNALGEQAEAGGGPALTAAALEGPLGITVDRALRLRFEDLAALIDAAGGVTVDVQRVIEDPNFPMPDSETGGVRFEPGLQWMNGERALQYARTRSGDDDYARTGRQQQVAQALARQLLNPLVWPGVMSVLSRLDTDLTVGDVMRMAPALLLNAGRFEQRTIDRSLMIPGENVALVVDWDALSPWVQAHFP